MLDELYEVRSCATTPSLQHHEPMLLIERELTSTTPPLIGWGEPTHTLIPWRQGFKYPTKERVYGLVRPNHLLSIQHKNLTSYKLVAGQCSRLKSSMPFKRDSVLQYIYLSK